MKRQVRKITYTIAAIVAAIVLIFSLISDGAVLNRTVAYAAVSENPVEKYENSNVWDDLQSAQIDGKSIDLSIYNFDKKKNLQIISFVEFCYSPFADKQDDYGLYVYVYNPRGLNFTEKPELNKIQLRYTGKTASQFEKYNLQLINRSTKPSYEGLFYKFKIEFTVEKKQAILSALNSTARKYEVSGIELYSSGANATEYNISNVYTYTGYATGYGSSAASEDTLSCKSEGLDLTLSLDVHSVLYRPKGNNGKNEYTQDMLHSVYFSIPNEIKTEYGGLSAVHASWLKVRTAPIFVTGNKDVYDAMYKSVFNNWGKPADLKYTLLANAEEYSIPSGVMVGNTDSYLMADKAYNADNLYSGYVSQKIGSSRKRYGYVKAPDSDLEQLYYLIYAENGNADEYTLSSDRLIKYIYDYTQSLLNDNTITTGGGMNVWEEVLNKYASLLFESVDENFTDMQINADDKYSIKSEVISQTWWEKLFGTNHIESSDKFNNIEAIHEVVNEDFIKNDIALTCQKLYIDENSYSDFEKFYNNAISNNETVYLFRYMTSEYESREVLQCERAESAVAFGKEILWEIDTNAYLAQADLFLDFDIIDVTCRKGNVKTILPVIMSPVDVTPDIKPPIDITPEPEKPSAMTFWQWLYNELFVKITWWLWVIVIAVGLTVIALLIKVISLLAPLIQMLFSGIWGLISAPFRAIAALIAGRDREDEEETKQVSGSKAKSRTKSKPKSKGKKK